jgi:hypothetical protein
MKTKTTKGKTFISRSQPWGLNYRNGHRALCADGAVRAIELAECADTFFSTPARCRIGGKTVTGYLTVETVDGSSVEMEGNPSVFVFRCHTNSKPEGFPSWPASFTEEHRALVSKAI